MKWLASKGMSTRRSRSARELDRENVQAVEQVGPKASGTHVSREVAVRCRDDSHVYLYRVATDALDCFRLKNAEQQRLKFMRQFADFIEQNRTAVRRLEPSDTPSNRSSERAGIVTEEFTRGEASHEPTAIRRDKRPRRSPTPSVNQFRARVLSQCRFPRE